MQESVHGGFKESRYSQGRGALGMGRLRVEFGEKVPHNKHMHCSPLP